MLAQVLHLVSDKICTKKLFLCYTSNSIDDADDDDDDVVGGVDNRDGDGGDDDNDNDDHDDGIMIMAFL